MTQKNNSVLPRNYLFVCTGNTCRSPFAQVVFNQVAKRRGIEAEALSCGLAAYPGQPPCDDAVAVAAQMGYDLSAMRARPATPYLMQAADAIYVMSPSHRDVLAQAMPGLQDKLFLLGEGIPDPYGGGPEADEQAYRAIEQAVIQLLDRREAQE